MDEFDIIDYVYEKISKEVKNIPIYKKRSISAEKRAHIVINNLSFSEIEDNLIGDVDININIFVPLNDNGTENIRMMKELKRKIKASLSLANEENKQKYLESEFKWSMPMPMLKEGFDCTNLRFNFNCE